MKPFKSFWIYSSIVLLSGCAGFQTKPYSFSSPKTDFMAEYCQSGKQKKAYKTTVIYFTPAIPKGITLDKANQKNKDLLNRKNVLLKKLFYLLGDPSSAEQVHNHGDEPTWYSLVSENEKDVLSQVKDENSTTQYRLYTFIIKILNQNKFIIYQSNLNSRRMSFDKGYSTDLNSLFTEYTLLTPKEVIEEITRRPDDPQYSDSEIILDENGEVNLSKAIDNRDRLWEAYINKFTTVKETPEDNSKKSIVELSLDLNAFCKYGRKISDIQSQ